MSKTPKNMPSKSSKRDSGGSVDRGDRMMGRPMRPAPGKEPIVRTPTHPGGPSIPSPTPNPAPRPLGAQAAAQRAKVKANPIRPAVMPSRMPKQAMPKAPMQGKVMAPPQGLIGRKMGGM